jgi:hypothetical protein
MVWTLPAVYRSAGTAARGAAAQDRSGSEVPSKEPSMMTMPTCAKPGRIAHIRIPRSAVVVLKRLADRQDFLCLACFEQEPDDRIAPASDGAGPRV